VATKSRPVIKLLLGELKNQKRTKLVSQISDPMGGKHKLETPCSDFMRDAVIDMITTRKIRGTRINIVLGVLLQMSRFCKTSSKGGRKLQPTLFQKSI
jgi:hypothetical protein